MKVRIYSIDMKRFQEYVAGALVLRDGKIVVEPATKDASDRRLLENIAREPLYVMINGRMRDVDPEQEPELFLQQLHRAYSGSVLRAGEVEKA